MQISWLVTIRDPLTRGGGGVALVVGSEDLGWRTFQEEPRPECVWSERQLPWLSAVRHSHRPGQRAKNSRVSVVHPAGLRHWALRTTHGCLHSTVHATAQGVKAGASSESSPLQLSFGGEGTKGQHGHMMRPRPHNQLM